MNSALKGHDFSRNGHLVLKGHGFSRATLDLKKKLGLHRPRKNSCPEGGGGFNPRIKPTESALALATDGHFLPIAPRNREVQIDTASRDRLARIDTTRHTN
jgi:hypothetical protein